MTVRIVVDFDVCEQHGQCVEAAPAIFRFDDEGQLQHPSEVGDESAADAEDAQFLCPTQAIMVTREP
ncbi:ferredoxin [Geodermatophilus sabuli]|uniref:Ferredoxin n=1 Tax=Geodermatophilus sabuli TaxID=1564158 RepID=A0A7K3VWD4_9ACTN|nr:ferredoxin [Geodermatophilus sabuli]